VNNIGTIRAIESTEQNVAGRPIKYRITDDKGKVYTLSAEQLRFACNQNVPGLPDITREVRMHSGNFQVLFAGNRAVFEGGGFGHGVGMCQYCSKGLGRPGALVPRDARPLLPRRDRAAPVLNRGTLVLVAPLS
jgi:SpoIID/LytB domain protein